jgi:hypothetical protein
MASVVSRQSYFEAGLDVLSDLGHGGLTLAEVCNRLGVTTGSFYHRFSGWPAYTEELVARRRIDTLIEVGLMLPRGAEAAIRVRSSVDRRPAARRPGLRPVRHGVRR